MLRVLQQYFNIRSFSFFILDGVLIFFTVPLAIGIQSFINPNFILTDYHVVPKTVFFVLISQFCLFHNELYSFEKNIFNRGLYIRLIQSIGAAGIILSGLTFFFRELIIGRAIFLTSLVISPLFLILLRYLYGIFLDQNILKDRILVIGSGSLAKEIGSEIESDKSHGFQIVTSVDEYSEKGDLIKNDNHSFREYVQLSRLVLEERIDQIIIALSERRGTLPVDELLKCKLSGVRIVDGISFYEDLTGKVAVEELKPSWLIYSEGFKVKKTAKIIKRSLDFLFASTGLVLSIPVFLVIPLLIKLDSTGPVFFRQDRIGENGKIFALFKFRSMKINAEAGSGPVWAKTNDSRATRIGKFIRKTRIDEIPQFLNVLKGEMSFVGPRPERPVFVDQLTKEIPFYPLRHSIKPGITGWAQIKYPYGSSVRDAMEKLQYDLYYLKNVSIFLDLAIIISTIRVVLSARGGR